jgi:hypothetical protein
MSSSDALCADMHCLRNRGDLWPAASKSHWSKALHRTTADQPCRVKPDAKQFHCLLAYSAVLSGHSDSKPLVSDRAKRASASDLKNLHASRIVSTNLSRVWSSYETASCILGHTVEPQVAATLAICGTLRMAAHPQ